MAEVQARTSRPPTAEEVAAWQKGFHQVAVEALAELLRTTEQHPSSMTRRRRPAA